VRPEEGGSTPLIRSDLVYDFIQDKFPQLIPHFETGVRYIRRVPQVDDPTSAIGRSWRSMYKVETREDAEVKMKEQGYDFEWVQVEDGSYDCKVISKVLPAIRVSTNGRKTFYN